MASLLSSQVDPAGLMSLLAPIVTGGAVAPPPPDAAPDPQAQASAANVVTPGLLAVRNSLPSRLKATADAIPSCGSGSHSGRPVSGSHSRGLSPPVR